MFFTTCRSISVPMWGLCRYRISSGAPAATKSASTCPISGSLTRVVSLPSEKVPAPPSPNCTLDLSSKPPPDQNLAISSWRLSTSQPRSTTTGRQPCRASVRAANMPAGPKPTTTGGLSSLPGGENCPRDAIASGASDTFLSFFQRLRSFFSLPCTATSSIYTNLMGAP